jgi:hypothetical protein
LRARLLGTTRRRDGRLQVTYDGPQMYYYVADAPGRVLRVSRGCLITAKLKRSRKLGCRVGTIRSRRVAAVYVRVVKFADVSAERIEGLVARIEAAEGPPPGVPATGLTLLFDEAQRTAVVLQHFATAEAWRPAGRHSARWIRPRPPGRASPSTCAR